MFLRTSEYRVVYFLAVSVYLLSMLDIKNVSKTFAEADNHLVIDDISISVKDGEFVCILGPSGSGKTVFLFLIGGFLKATSGEIILDGKPVDRPNTDRILVFQDFSLFPWRTVYGNVVFGLEKIKLPEEKKRELANQYLEMVGLSKYKNWYPHTISGGMKQRVAIARALISDPKILLLDEPFSALDPEYRRYMRQSLQRIWQKTQKTMIFVTHSIGEAVYLADTIYLFSNLPAKITRTYHINLPRPRDQRSSEFIKITRDIENEVQKEFIKTLEQDPLVNQALNTILEEQINNITI